MKCTFIIAVIFLSSVSSIFAQVPSQLQKPFSRVELLAVLQSGQTETTTPAKDPTKQIRTGGSVVPPKLIHWVGPTYPDFAKSAGIQGTVRFDAVIGKDGKLHNIKLLSGDPVLVKSAVEAVSKWRYRPCLLNGKPAEIRSEVAVDFKPQNGSH